jgi:ParB-like chromosome segregation protein Spo0J
MPGMEETTIPIKKIVIHGRHRKKFENIDTLASSIEDLGLLHPVVLDSSDRLVAGPRRIKAFKLLGETESPYVVVKSVDEAHKLLRAEAAENVCRQPFKPSEAVAMGAAIEKIAKLEARKRQAHGQTALGRKNNASGKLPEAFGETRNKVGDSVGLSGRTYEKANAAVASGDKKLIEEMDRTEKVDGVYKRLNVKTKAAAIRAEPPPLPTGPFRVLVVDPPWHYDRRPNDPSHRAANPYPSMSVEEIKALNVGGIATADSILWLWTTNTHLPESFGIIEQWGLRRMGHICQTPLDSTTCMKTRVNGQPIGMGNTSTSSHRKAIQRDQHPENIESLVGVVRRRLLMAVHPNRRQRSRRGEQDESQ